MFKAAVIALPLTPDTAHMRRSLSEHIGGVLTYTRIPVGITAVTLILLNYWHLAAAVVGLFVLLDLVDGRFARLGNKSDTGQRRLADATIDKVSVHLCALGVCIQMPEIIALWLPLLLRDLVQAGVGLWLLTHTRRRVVVAGAWWHRFFSLAMAIWGIAMLWTRWQWRQLAMTALAIGIVTMVDYVAQCHRILLASSQGAQNEWSSANAR